jgi:hypothetical protein
MSYHVKGLVVTHESHLDHVPYRVIRHVLEQGKDLTSDTVLPFDCELPAWFQPVTRALVGPACGDPVVTEDEVYYAYRPGRNVKSRLILREPVETMLVRGICVPVTQEGQTLLVLKTVYGIAQKGEQVAPMEPGDTKLLKKDEPASKQFWHTHALCEPAGACGYCHCVWDPIQNTPGDWDRCSQCQGL